MMFDSQAKTFDVVTRGKGLPSPHLVMFSLAAFNAAFGVSLLAIAPPNTGGAWFFLAISVLLVVAAGTHLALQRYGKWDPLHKVIVAVFADISKMDFSDLNPKSTAQDVAASDDGVWLDRRENKQLRCIGEPLSILALVDNCVSVFERSRMSNAVDIKIEISTDVPRHVLGDKAFLNQMIGRLLESSNRQGFPGFAKLVVDRDWEVQNENVVRFAIKAMDMKRSPGVPPTGAAHLDGPTFHADEADCETAYQYDIADRMRRGMGICGDPLEAMLSFRIVLPPACAGWPIVKDRRTRGLDARESVQSCERLSAS